jgi:hypothetical protein
VIFYFYTGIGFVPIIADSLSAFPFPVTRVGIIVPNLRESLFHYPKAVFFQFLFLCIRVFPEFLRIGCCISAIVANSFRTISLSLKTDPAAFLFLTGTSFDTAITGLTLAFSFPIARDDKIVFGTQYRLSPPLVFDKLRLRGWFPTMPVSRNRTRSLAKFSKSVAVFPFLLPNISLQFPFPITRDDLMAFLNFSGIGFVLIIADDFSAFSFPIESGWLNCFLP